MTENACLLFCLLESPGNNTASWVGSKLKSEVSDSLRPAGLNCENLHSFTPCPHVPPRLSCPRRPSARARHRIQSSSSAPRLTLCSNLCMEINSFKLHYFDKSWLNWWICAPAKCLVWIYLTFTLTGSQWAGSIWLALSWLNYCCRSKPCIDW